MKVRLMLTEDARAGTIFNQACETVERALNSHWLDRQFGAGLREWACVVSASDATIATDEPGTRYDKANKRVESRLTLNSRTMDASDLPAGCDQLARSMLRAIVQLDELSPPSIGVGGLLHDVLSVAQSKKWLPDERPNVRCFYSDNALDSHVEPDEAFLVTCHEAIDHWDGLADEPRSFMGLFDPSDITLQFYWFDQDQVDIDVPAPEQNGAYNKPGNYWECLNCIIEYSIPLDRSCQKH